MTWTSYGMCGEEDAWSSLRRLQRDMGQLFDGRSSMLTREFPALNVWTGAENAIVAVELPGVNQKELEVTVLGRTLTVKGERKMPKSEEGESFIRRERHGGSFVRTLELPFEVRADDVTAEYVNGVLKIKLPRAEAQKARKIAIG